MRFGHGDSTLFSVNSVPSVTRGSFSSSTREKAITVHPGESSSTACRPANWRRCFAPGAPARKVAETHSQYETAEERLKCEPIEDGRCRRIARGSGSRPEDVEQLLRDFRAIKQIMQKFAGMGMMERMRSPRMNPDRPDGFRGFELN